MKGVLAEQAATISEQSVSIREKMGLCLMTVAIHIRTPKHRRNTPMRVIFLRRMSEKMGFW
jgi:hypothetical protein